MGRADGDKQKLGNFYNAPRWSSKLARRGLRAKGYRQSKVYGSSSASLRPKRREKWANGFAIVVRELNAAKKGRRVKHSKARAKRYR